MLVMTEDGKLFLFCQIIVQCLDTEQRLGMTFNIRKREIKRNI